MKNTILNSLAVAVPTGISVQSEDVTPVIVSAVLTFLIELSRIFFGKKRAKKEEKKTK